MINKHKPIALEKKSAVSIFSFDQFLCEPVKTIIAKMKIREINIDAKKNFKSSMLTPALVQASFGSISFTYTAQRNGERHPIFPHYYILLF